MQTNLPKATTYIENNWEQLKDKNIKYLRDILKDVCQPYEEKKLQKWFNDKKDR